MNDIFYLDATEMVSKIRNRDLSVLELITAHVDRIASVNPQVNAIVSQQLEQALEQAAAADAALASGVTPGPLFGLPVAHKDSFLTQGIRTTFGSSMHKDFIPTEDSAVVERQKRAGAITLGKTNMPEFGAGSHTFNDIFGMTRNPYRLDVSAGGSSGGATAALAAGMVALADGTDMGGSLRNPASFCNVVGLRPSIGCVPMAPSGNPFNTLTTGGPLGRTVADVALLLDVIAGADPRDPLSHASALGDFHPLPRLDPKGTRIGLSSDLGGLPFDQGVQQVFTTGVGHLQAMGCHIEEAEPDFDGADQAFEALRALAFVTNYESLLHQQAGHLKDTIRWNIDQGLALSGAQIAQAQRAQALMFSRMRAFLDQHDFLVAPVVQVPPFAVEQEYPQEIAQVKMDNYIEWMRSCYRITITGHPAISLPCGFTEDGLPVGIQIIGKYRQERELLAFAQAFESANPVGRIRPQFS